MTTLFFSYSHVDESLRDQLEKQLAMLKRQGVIDTWHDRRIGAGQQIDSAIDAAMEAAAIILLLVSPDFIASDYCYEREMTRAMQLHASCKSIVIPVILRACDWHGAPFGKLLATPTDGRPVTQWPDRDQAFLEVAKSIRLAIDRSLPKASTSQSPRAGPPLSTTSQTSVELPSRSSNLRMTKQFSERDKDIFKLETFEYMARYFENSLSELAARNSGIEVAYRRFDANRFSAVVYRNGAAVARCTIFIGSRSFGNAIAYTATETSADNSFNECLNIEADEQALFVRSMGMNSLRGRQENEKLSEEGAAELYWAMLIEPLQRG